MNDAAAAVIKRQDLARHPEGGWFRETHRSPVVIEASALPPGYPGPRAALTSILYMLACGEQSRSHRVRSEELWIHQGGDELALTLRAPAGEPKTVILGRGENAAPQVVVPPGWWQAARPLSGSHGYALVGCVVAPGFDFEDFELEDSAGDAD